MTAPGRVYSPAHGDFLQRYDGRSNVHIANVVEPTEHGLKVTVACGQVWWQTDSGILRHASEMDNERRPCHKCWEAM